MRGSIFILAGLALVSLAAVIAAPVGRAQAPSNPFVQPWMQKPGQAPPSAPATPQYVPRIDKADVFPLKARQPEGPDPCAELFITTKVGAWVITIISYSTKVENAADMAREMCLYLRGEPYKLPAYVYLHGAEAKRKEDERVQREILEHQEAMRAKGIASDPTFKPRRVRIEVEYAVLVGGYPDMEAAKRERDRLRLLPPPDPRKVKLATLAVGNSNSKKDPEPLALNPFKTAMIGPNPTVPPKHQASEKEDIGLLRRLNAEEEYSLLKNKKDVTLLVKVIQLPTVVEQNQGTASKVMSGLGLGGTTSVDAAKVSAHNLAELLHKHGKLEAYVLHRRYDSFVTVGGYSRSDPNDEQRLINDTQRLAELNTRLDPRMQLLPKAMPMPVPR